MTSQRNNFAKESLTSNYEKHNIVDISIDVSRLQYGKRRLQCFLYCIDMGSLHQLQVLEHQFLRHHTGFVGVVLMSIDATYFDRLTVDE